MTVLAGGLAALLLANAGVFGAAAAGDSGDRSAAGRCGSATATLRLATASGIERAVTDAVDRVTSAADADTCVEVEIVGGDGFDGAVRLRDGDAHIWIPDSRARAYVVDPALAAAAPSVATSPVVMSVSPTTAAAMVPAASASDGLTWGLLVPNDATAGLRFESQDSSASSVLLAAADAVTASAHRASGDIYLAYAAASAALGPFSDDAADTESPVADDTIRVSELREVAEGDVVVPTSEAAPVLDYPWVEPPEHEGGRHPLDASARAVAHRILDELRSPDSLADLDADGLLPPDSTSTTTPDGARIATQTGAASTPAPILYAIVGADSFSARVLTLLDVSGSMADIAPGDSVSAMQAVNEATVAFATRMPDDMIVGGRVFGHQIAPPNDWIETLPSGRLGDNRAAVIAAAQAATAQPTGTALYQSYLDTYRAAQRDYDPDEINTIAVFTDGRNEFADDRLDLPGLLAELQRISDPARPVGTMFFGFGDADLDAMAQIVAVSGGGVWDIDDPEQIFGAIIEATAGVTRITLPAEPEH